MKTLKGKTALVTGASSGIGEAFANELAERGSNLVLTARSKEKLESLAVFIRAKYHVRVWAMAADLSVKEMPDILFNEITAAGLSIDVLVNNAGVGKWTNFLDETMQSYEDMIRLNITSLMKLSYLALPDMIQKKEGGIIQVASTGSFQPCPYITTYCATKAFVLSFSEGLHGEYRRKGISVTALCPGNTDTGFQHVAKANTAGMRADNPQTVAKKGIDAMLAGKSYTVVGIDNYLTSLLPRFLTRRAIINLVSGMMGKRVNG